MKHTLSDIAVMVKRNLIKYRRIPQLLVFSTIQPVMFLFLFTYVFGGAITTGVDYIKFLLPGILVQTMLFGAMQTGIGLVDDLSKGMIDRFRSLPMSQSAVLMGRTLADMSRNLFVIVLMTLVGYILGFRIEHGLFHFLGAIGLMMLFGFAFSWVSATIGLAVKTPETAQVAGMFWIFPLAFASSIFVPIQSMKGWIKVFAEHNPITYTVNAVRSLTLGLPMGNDLWYSLIWIAVILAVAVPLGVRSYRKIT